MKKRNFKFSMRLLDKACFLVSIMICSVCLSAIGCAMVKTSIHKYDINGGNRANVMNVSEFVCSSDSVSIVR